MDLINIDYLKKLEIKVGTVTECVPIEKSEKLLKLSVDFGTETRTILSGIAKVYAPETLIGRQLPFITNLEEREMMGIKSQGMLFAVDNGGEAVLLLPDKAVTAGSSVI
jgi:methionyl-tRNA synthetase